MSRRLVPALAALLALILVACSAPGVPLTEVDLEQLLVADGDLPIGVSAAQIRDAAPEMFEGMPAAEQVRYQQLARDGEQTGGVAVFLYGDEAARTEGYQLVADGFSEAEPVADLGEQAIVTLPNAQAAAIGLNFTDVLFQRCAAVVHIRLRNLEGEDSTSAIAYAKRLDERLEEAVCQ